MTTIYIPEAQRPPLSAHARKLADLAFHAGGSAVGTAMIVSTMIAFFGAVL
nr:hypothetical protein [uncultured Cohaesibacter sp.]